MLPSPFSFIWALKMSQCMRFATMWYVRPAKPQINCAYAQSDQSLCQLLENSISFKLLTEYYLELLSLTGGCTGLSESTLVKLPHCWKSHVTAQMLIGYSIFLINIYLGILVIQLGTFVNFTYQLIPPSLMSVLRSFNKVNTIYVLLLL